MDEVAQSLLAAQNKAVALFDEIVAGGLIQAGKLESQLTADIHALAKQRFGVDATGTSASRARVPTRC